MTLVDVVVRSILHIRMNCVQEYGVGRFCPTFEPFELKSEEDFFFQLTYVSRFCDQMYGSYLVV
jgi:hypothetical protein